MEATRVCAVAANQIQRGRDNNKDPDRIAVLVGQLQDAALSEAAATANLETERAEFRKAKSRLAEIEGRDDGNGNG